MGHAQFETELGSWFCGSSPPRIMCSPAIAAKPVSLSIGDSGFVMVVSTSSQTRPAQPRALVHRGYLEAWGGTGWC